ncbi:GNAT family N-acetyltransferase [Calidifontibacter sp. DB0510]|uniref:GNAT family N-acetyltransferase n=1 Tax=Metallococcus carri TaxID=1656884 RepID=A0A967B096_9MICO|nr:GNAT family protein [Metallococcus carri]NHN55644.1 GNAT family N-acetyltransferase [Metallococcus carri]NOP38172.1 GNAT family N-acetyltransferase [Calidifontibacter sp. DB2511S]
MIDRPWPVALAGEWRGRRIVLRPLRVHADRREFLLLRQDNAAWNGPWDSSTPNRAAKSMSFAQLVRRQDEEAKAGRLLPFALEVDGALAGQVHLSGISRGALLSGALGYWIAESLAGQGITPYAVALVNDHAFGPLGLHRVEVNVRPDNTASLRVVAKLRMRDEGVRRAYLHVDGRWHDHRSFALTVEDLAGRTAVERLSRFV